MKRHLSVFGALAGAAALLASSLLVTATAATAVTPTGTGNLTVKIVDQYGRATSGEVLLVNSDSQIQDPTSQIPEGSSLSYSISTGDYALEVITPWSGLTCLGVAPASCTFGEPTYQSPAITVQDSSVAPSGTTYTVHVTVPYIVGSNTVGAPLSVHIPASLTALLNVYDTASPGVIGQISVQWMRGSTAINGATHTAYKTVREDGSQPISAHLSLGVTAGLASASYPDFATMPVAMKPAVKSKTKTTIKVPKIKGDERVSAKVKVTTPGWVVTGYVTVKIGKFKVKKTLKDGVAYVTLPRLASGTHTVKTKYLGGLYYQASKAKNKKIKVRH